MSHDRNARKFEDTKLVIKTVNRRISDTMAESKRTKKNVIGGTNMVT